VLYDRVSVGRYQHYFIETTAEEDQYLAIDLYTNKELLLIFTGDGKTNKYLT